MFVSLHQKHLDDVGHAAGVADKGVGDRIAMTYSGCLCYIGHPFTRHRLKKYAVEKRDTGVYAPAG